MGRQAARNSASQTSKPALFFVLADPDLLRQTTAILESTVDSCAVKKR
jgi:hypothetical protein